MNRICLEPGALIVAEAQAGDCHPRERIALDPIDPKVSGLAKIDPVQLADNEGPAMVTADPEPGKSGECGGCEQEHERGEEDQAAFLAQGWCGFSHQNACPIDR